MSNASSAVAEGAGLDGSEREKRLLSFGRVAERRHCKAGEHGAS